MIKGIRITQAQALNIIDPQELILRFADPLFHQHAARETAMFLKYNYSVPRGVLMVVIINALNNTKGDFNAAYLRRGVENLERMKITSTNAAIEFLKKKSENQKFFEEKDKKVVKPVPEWFDKELARLDEFDK